MATQGQCAKCNNLNEYSKIHCDFCGARLPWGDAIQGKADAPLTTYSDNVNASDVKSTKKNTDWLGVVVAFVLVGVVGLVVASSSNGGSSSESPPTGYVTSSAPKQWRKLTEHSGTGIKTTEPFVVSGSQWRINYMTDAGQYGAMNFQIYVYNADGSLKDVAANVIGKAADTTNVYGAGTYYLTINTAQPYALNIFEYS